jgi:hypothetical protein
MMAYLWDRGKKNNKRMGNDLEKKGLSVKNTGCNDFVATSCGHDTSRRNDIVRNKVLKFKFSALIIPYGIPTVGQLPNQLPKATNQRPRTKSATNAPTTGTLYQLPYIAIKAF